MAGEERELRVLSVGDGVSPVQQWYDSVRDKSTRVRVFSRLLRAQHGNYGDHKNLGDDVFELRLHFGPGYRIYFAEYGNEIVVLLFGGDKGSQAKDIASAKLWWRQYRDETDRFKRSFRG